MTSRTSNTARDALGVIVTMQRRDTGELVSVHRPGLTKSALRACLELFDPEEWFCASVSTPRTILLDLRGRPQSLGAVSRPVHNGLSRDETTARMVQTPEMALLSMIGAKEYRQ